MIGMKEERQKPLVQQWKMPLRQQTMIVMGPSPENDMKNSLSWNPTLDALVLSLLR